VRVISPRTIPERNPKVKPTGEMLTMLVSTTYILYWRVLPQWITPAGSQQPAAIGNVPKCSSIP
jgi:hypothetical protein